MLVPAGEHQIVFEFRPQGYITAAYITSFSSLIILLLLIGAGRIFGLEARKQKRYKFRLVVETGHTPSLQLDETAIDKIEQFSR